MSLRQKVTTALESGLDVSIEVLQFVDSLAGVFPPLQTATGGALYIAQAVQSFRRNKAEWESFSTFVTEMVAEVALRTQSYDLSTKEALPWKKNLEQLATALTKIVAAVKKNREKLERPLAIIDPRSYRSNGGMAADMRKDLDQVLAAFQLMTNLTIGHTLVDVIKSDKATFLQLDSLKQNAVLERLQFAKHDHYDESSLCLEGTRTVVNRCIMDWCRQIGNDGKRIMLLTAVAGAGKSSIAHTISKECTTQGILLSSFFFKAGEQSQPTFLFSDMARSLAMKSIEHRDIIISTLEGDPKLATASFTTQFKELIQAPLRLKQSSSGEQKSMVVIIDALDECDAASFGALADVLREEVPRLPPSIKFFVTSRQVDLVDRYLSSDSIQRLSIDLADEVNVQDCTTYIGSQLEKLSRAHPESTVLSKKDVLTQEIASRADGLFIWISTIFNYLKEKSGDPMVTLGKLLDTGASRNSERIPAEKMMDELYTSILGRCDWEDDEFVHDYPIVLGAIINSERPLSMTAWDSILSPFLRSSVRRTVVELSPLLTGIHHPSTPIRILHQSFRDFVVEHATTGQRYMVETDKDHERMALSCFQMMFSELSKVDDLGRVLPLGEKDPLRPISPACITEQLGYACRYAHVHASMVHFPSEELEVYVRAFLAGQMVNWIELCVRTEGYISVASFPEWAKSYIDTTPTDRIKKTAGVLNQLCLNLRFVERLNEAYESSMDAVRLHRVLVVTDWLSYVRDLAVALHSLFICLSGLGRHSDALPPIEESVNLCRQSVAANPGSHTFDLAASLESLSTGLFYLGRHSDALPPMEESVGLFRKLFATRPASNTSRLAISLVNLSNRLSSLARVLEALSFIEESVDLCRKLVAEHPAYDPSGLAVSLIGLSHRLCFLDRQSRALPYIEEAVSLYRKLVATHPSSYTSYLAISLLYQSRVLSELQRDSEALPFIQECIFLYRPLAAAHPSSHTPILTISLSFLSFILSNLGRYAEALDAGEESLSLFRPLVANYPLAYTHYLQVALGDVARALDGLGKNDEALTARMEANSLS